ACGNVLETEEAILALRGEGPPDLLEVTYALGVEMLLQGGIEKNTKKARKKLETAIESGLAAEKFEQIIEAQGGNPKAVEDPSVLPQALAVEVYAAPRTGVVQRVEPRTSGRAVIALGGGQPAASCTSRSAASNSAASTSGRSRRAGPASVLGHRNHTSTISRTAMTPMTAIRHRGSSRTSRFPR